MTPKRLILLVLLVWLCLLLLTSASSAAITAFQSPTVAPTDAPDLPPGTGGDDFDIVEWLTWLAGPLSGVFVAWFLERTQLSKLVNMLAPEARRNVALILSGAFGVAACGLLSLITELPAGSVAVINALLAMVFSQVMHGRMVLAGKG